MHIVGCTLWGYGWALICGGMRVSEKERKKQQQ